MAPGAEPTKRTLRGAGVAAWREAGHDPAEEHGEREAVAREAGHKDDPGIVGQGPITKSWSGVIV
jgi:hypothetical protein